MMFILRFNYIHYILIDGEQMTISSASGKSKPFVNLGNDKKLEKQSTAKALKNENYELAGKIIGVKISRDNLNESSILNSKTEKRLAYAEKNTQISTALFKYIDGSKNKENLVGVINKNSSLKSAYIDHVSSDENVKVNVNVNGFKQPTRDELNESNVNSLSAPDKNKETTSHLTPKETNTSEKVKKSKPKISFENKNAHSDKRAETSVQTKRITTSPTLKTQEKVMVGQSSKEVNIDGQINKCNNEISELKTQLEDRRANKGQTNAEISELRNTRDRLLMERKKITEEKWSVPQIEGRKNELTREINDLKEELKALDKSMTSGMKSEKNDLMKKQLEAETLLKRLNGQV